MSKQPLLTEATQKRLLLLAGMSHYSDEVLTESKNGIPAEPDYTGGEKALKPAPGAKKTEGAKEPKDDKKKLNEEIPQDDSMAPAPVSPSPEVPPPAPSPLEGAPAAPGNSANVDLKKFAQEFASFLKSQGHEITFTVDGEDVSQDIGATEDEFGEVEPEPGFGEEPSPEAAPEPSPEAAPEPPEAEPKLESKERKVARLVYEEVLRSLTSNVGKKASKVQVKIAPKK